MTIPVSYDLFISLICLSAGLYVCVWKLNMLSTKYTPALSAMIVSLGILNWAVIALASYSNMVQEPYWAYSIGFTGSWIYTTSRVFASLSWLLMLYHICRYSPKRKEDVKADIS